MKGIILAGGKGTRLFPATAVQSKHLLPVYDKPMIHYPLSTLMAAGIREILLVVSPEGLESYRQLLGDGTHLGIQISYQVQPEPRGIGQGLVLAEKFACGEPVCVILGDNLFLGTDPVSLIPSAPEGARIFCCPVENPKEYGVAELGNQMEILSIAEKPAVPRSNLAITGLYLFDGQACSVARDMRESDRGELEICDILNYYLAQGSLGLKMLPEDTRWIDAGTPDRILTAAKAVQEMQNKTGRLLACVEETAWRQGFITTADLAALAERYWGTAYGQYLRSLVEGERI